MTFQCWNPLDDSLTVPVEGTDYTITQNLANGKNGLRLWASSVALARAVSQLTLNNETVDFGCGLGLVGIVVGTNVTFIDRDQEVLYMAQQNAQNNGKDGVFDPTDYSGIDAPVKKFDNFFASDVGAAAINTIARLWNGNGTAIVAETETGQLSFLQQAGYQLLNCGYPVSTDTVEVNTPDGRTETIYLHNLGRRLFARKKAKPSRILLL